MLKDIPKAGALRKAYSAKSSYGLPTKEELDSYKAV